MLQLSPSMRIFVCHQPVDFRKGIDGLAAVCRAKLQEDPFQGALFIFRNRGLSAIRLLTYDGQGFWLCIKRLSKGKFQWWPEDQTTVDARQITVDARQIQTLFWNGNTELAKFSDDGRKI